MQALDRVLCAVELSGGQADDGESRAGKRRGHSEDARDRGRFNDTDLLSLTSFLLYVPIFHTSCLKVTGLSAKT